MGGNYERGLYNQLMEVMERLDTVEKESKKEIRKLNDEISTLKKENQQLKEENRLLRDDNARMKSILSNDSSNTSQSPSTDQKGGKPANTYNSREKTGRKAGGQKGHGGTTAFAHVYFCANKAFNRAISARAFSFSVFNCSFSAFCCAITALIFASSFL